MEYIIFDLEWNNAYSPKVKKCINEIIEIGALKLDENLNVIDSFKQLIKPSLTKKLTSRVKKLTHISNDDVVNGTSFTHAIKEFSTWAGEGDNLFMSWSNTDLYMLSECFLYFNNECNLSFIKKYADVQKYCQSFFDDLENNNQISLINAATKLNIEINKETLHRALHDCFLTAKCLSAVYDKEKLNQYIHICDKDFFAKLLFKPYYITDLTKSNINLDSYSYLCPECNNELVRKKEWEQISNMFRTTFRCKKCSKKYWVTVRVKQEYKKLNKKIRIVKENKNKQNYKITNKNIEKS